MDRGANDEEKAAGRAEVDQSAPTDYDHIAVRIGNGRLPCSARRFVHVVFRVAVPMEINAADHRPIEELTDTELLDQYRYVAAEFAEETEFNRDGDNGPAAVLEDELKRRGVPVPTQSSLVSPGREVADPERENA